MANKEFMITLSKGQVDEGALSNVVSVFPSEAITIKKAEDMFTREKARDISNPSKTMFGNLPCMHPGGLEAL